MLYDAFISYSRAADGKLAPEIQRALGQLAKPFWKRRALRVFRDETTLDLTPELWPGIQAALDSSGYFILFASPEAAKSQWVCQEIDHWLNRQPECRLLLALTRGTIIWDKGAKDFDWERTTALPPSLRGVFGSVPHYVDFTWVEREGQISLRDPRFHDACARFAARIHGIPLDELVGRDKQEHRRTWVAIWTAVSLLALLVVVATTFGVVAERQRIQAEAQKLAAQSELLRRAEPGRLAEAVGLARTSFSTKPTREGWEALWNGLQSLPTPVATLEIPAEAKVVSFDGEGHTAAVGCDDGTLIVLSGPRWSDQRRRSLDEPIGSLLFDEKGSYLFAGSKEAIHAIRLASLETEWSQTGLTSPQPIAVSDGGQTLVYLDRERCRFLNVASQQERRSFAVPHNHRFMGISSNETLALLSYREGPFDGCGLWDLRSTQKVWQDEAILRNVLHLAVASSSGRWLGLVRGLSPPPNQLVIIDREAPEEKPVFLDHRKEVQAAEFTPDEEGLVTGSADGTCRLWSLDGTEQWRVDLQAGVRSLKIAARSTMLVVATDDGMLRALDLQSGREWVRVNAGRVPDRWAVSPDGRWLIVADASRHVRIWEMESGSISGRYVYQKPGTIAALAATPDAGLMALEFKPVSHARDSDRVQFFEPTRMTLRPSRLTPELPWIFGAAFDRTGAWFATLSQPHIRSAETLQLWNTQTGREVDSLPLKGGLATD